MSVTPSSEVDVSDLLTVDEAIRIIDEARVARAIDVPIEQAQGLRLAQDVVSDRDYPPFDKSLMDGFAVRAGDVSTVPATLRVIGEIPAGQESTRAVGAGEAMAIMTGAPMPGGADGVVPVEDVERISSSEVRVMRATAPGRFISRRASDVKSGAGVLRAGTVLESAQLAVAASVGAARVHVYARPRVAVLSTGDELVPIDATPRGSQIRNSNNLMLVALLRKLGCDVHDLGVARDHPDTIRDAMLDGLKSADVLFVTGGMSMGEYDYCPRVMREIGVDLRVTKLKIKPGKPFIFGTTPDGKFIFGLPGNPVSGFVCTIRLAARLLQRMAGGSCEPRWIDGKLAAPLSQNGPREFYQPVVLESGGNVRPLGWKGSADVFTLAQANALLRRPEREPALPAGAVVRVLEI